MKKSDKGTLIYTTAHINKHEYCANTQTPNLGWKRNSRKAALRYQQ
jgi:hypothetical protein